MPKLNRPMKKRRVTNTEKDGEKAMATAQPTCSVSDSISALFRPNLLVGTNSSNYLCV